VIEALRELDQVVLGYEIWVFGDESPTWQRSSEYKLDESKEWHELVEVAAALAIGELITTEMQSDSWVNLTWISRMEFENRPGPIS
jgi:hypothetical protein